MKTILSILLETTNPNKKEITRHVSTIGKHQWYGLFDAWHAYAQSMNDVDVNDLKNLALLFVNIIANATGSSVGTTIQNKVLTGIQKSATLRDRNLEIVLAYSRFFVDYVFVYPTVEINDQYHKPEPSKGCDIKQRRQYHKDEFLRDFRHKTNRAYPVVSQTHYR